MSNTLIGVIYKSHFEGPLSTIFLGFGPLALVPEPLGHSRTTTPTSPTTSPLLSSQTSGFPALLMTGNPVTLTLDHGHRADQVEVGQAHQVDQKMDGDPEEQPDLRAQVATALPFSFHGRHLHHPSM